MAASFDSDDDDTFVTIGTPLEVLDEDEIPRKPVQLQDQKAKDKRGRERFHGAFTGGFSAGFFNTVGTKEGFVPSTFVSSRSQKPDEGGTSKYGQRPEDFMDEEDLDEFGIAPKKITASDDFASISSLRKRKMPTSGRSAIPDFKLDDLVLPSKIPIGMRLLKKMGWKEGQGVGARVRKKHKPKPATQSGAKVYGCAFRPPDDGSSSSDDCAPANVTFAPKDMSHFTFEPKDNLHGIGYRGLNPQAALQGHINLFEPPAPVSKSGKKGITGHAFGVGALNEDDDDVYGLQSMTHYDRELTDEMDTSYGWTAPKHKLGSSQKLAIKGPDYIGKMLEGFKLSSKSGKPKKSFPPPSLPRDFRPFHVFKKPVDVFSDPCPPPVVQQKDEVIKLDANTRGVILGEKSLIGSIFDLVSKEDKAKMTAVKGVSPGPGSQPSPATPAAQLRGKFKSFAPAADESPQPMTPSPATPSSSSRTPVTPASSSQSLGADTPGPPTTPMYSGGGFKPFARDAEKQARYEEYLDAQKHGRTYVNRDPNLTEWERGHEIEEFSRAAKLYKPMSSMIASRFTRGKFEDNVDTVEVTIGETEKSDQAKAADMKMYGKMTRDMIEWHPDKLLCKRFNVANPYPDSSQVGTSKVRKDKFSVFNFMSTPKEKEKKPHSPPKAIEFKEDPPPTQSTPVTEKLPSRPAVSFVIGTAKKKDSIEVTKEEALAGPEKREEDTEDIEMEKEKERAEDDRPPMDLFKAIFDASDSSSSSSDENEDEGDKTEQKDNSKNLNIVKQSSESEGKRVHRFSLPGKNDKKSRWDPVPSVEKVSPMETDELIPPAANSNNVDLNSSITESKDDSAPDKEAIEVRLGLDKLVEKADNSEDEVYGPMPLFYPPLPSKLPGQSSDKLKKDKVSKKKHKHKDKHKKKKKKDKKNKHKKKKKVKHKHKKKVVPSSSSDSEYETMSDSSDGDEPSTRDLLSKIRSLPSSSKRMSAADFM